MNQAFKVLILGLLAFVLVGCKPRDYYTYYMENPKALTPAYNKCVQLSDDQDQEAEELHCQAMMQAAQDMRGLLFYAATRPENFGNELLTIQSSIVNNQQALTAAKKTLQHYLSSASDADVTVVAEQRQLIQQLQQKITVQQTTVKVHYAVINLLQSMAGGE